MSTHAAWNSSNPLAFPPPTDAVYYQAGCYMFTSNLTAYIYDWLLSISEEHEIGLFIASSSVASLNLLITTACYTIASIKHCQNFSYAVAGLSAVSILSTSFLFLLRVRAIYQNSRCITIIFGFFWLVMLGLAILDVTALRAMHIPHTQHCYNSNQNINYLAIPSIITCANDTLVFLAISYRLAGNAATENSWRARIRSFVTGDGLYSLSRSLLQSGQVYYFTTIAFFFVNLAMMVSPRVPVALRYILAPAHAAVTNIVACHVFRGVALGTIEDSALTTTKIAAAFRSAPPVVSDESIM